MDTPKAMTPGKLLFCIASLVVLVLLVMACTRDLSSTPASSPTPSPVETTSPLSTPTMTYITDFSAEDCNFKIPDELGEITGILRTDVDNEPKINVERVFRRFHQGESPSTILRCDMRSGGLFTTWWVQSLESEQAAFDLFQGLIGGNRASGGTV